MAGTVAAGAALAVPWYLNLGQLSLSIKARD